MLDVLKVIILGIVEGITEWLPVSSTGHLILVGDLLSPDLSDKFMEMFNVVIQLGAIMAVVVIYFHKLNPFSPRKTNKQKMITWQMWIKVFIASIPAGVVGVLFNDILDELFYKPLPVAVMLIVYGVLFIIIENRNKGKRPSVTKISELSVSMLLWIGFFQMLALSMQKDWVHSKTLKNISPLHFLFSKYYNYHIIPKQYQKVVWKFLK